MTVESLKRRFPVLLERLSLGEVGISLMEKYTFPTPEVRSAWARYDTLLLKADVTANDQADQALMRHFGIFGPSAYLFFDRDGQEQRNYRVVGFTSAEEFAEHLEKALSP
jgi:thiol:disulfide interchange protein DsbD